MNEFFAIIIPFKRKTELVDKCIQACLRQTYQNYKIILLPDKPTEFAYTDEKILIYPTGNFLPGKKRNIGIEKIKADIYAFLDSDAIPEKNWLEIARKYFNKEEIKILGGPNLTPENSPEKEKIAGEILSHPFITGKFAIRYKKIEGIENVTEMPLCNLFIKKEVFEKIGKFREDILTGEDADFCFRALKAGIKTWYTPELVVYHQRRPVFLPFFNQIFQYAFDKGFVVRKSFDFFVLYYFLPSIFVLFVICGLWLNLFLKNFYKFYLGGLFIYFFLLFFGSFKKKRRVLIFFLSIFLIHLIYGTGFLIGIFSIRKRNG